MKRNLRWSITDSSQASFTRAVDERGAPSTIDMKPIASLGPHTSTTFSPMTISTTPDCTTYMQAPASLLLNTTFPACKVMVVPALLANIRMSISLPSIVAPLPLRSGDVCRCVYTPGHTCGKCAGDEQTCDRS